MNSKNIWITVACIIVVAVLAVVVWRGTSPKSSPSTQTPQAVNNPIDKVAIQEVEKTKAPEGFPSDVPIEKGAEITLNFQGTNAKGVYQASREFISQKTATENFDMYQKVLKENGWTITNAIDDTARNQKIILATKANSSLNIRIYTTKGQVRVSINNEVGK